MIQSMTRIKAILDSISDSILPLKFSYLESQPASFPAAVLTSLGAKEIQKDSIANEITESWAVRLIYVSEESAAGQTKWMTLIDALGAELRKSQNITLGGDAVNFVIKQIPPPTSFDTGYSQPVVVFDIIVDAVILKNIN
jgi:hypothetical protein